MQLRPLPAALGLAIVAGLGAVLVRGTDEPARAELAGAAPALDLTAVGAPYVPNLGQWDHQGDYVFRSGPLSMLVEDHGWLLTLVEPRPATEDDLARHQRARLDSLPQRAVAIRMEFENVAPAPQPRRHRGEGVLPGHHDYFLGNDPTRWRTEVPLYAAVVLEAMYPGIDLRLREAGGYPEYDLLLEPGADLGQVHVRVDGAQGLHLDADGALVIDTDLGPIRQSLPHTWQTDPAGERSAVPCRYVLLGADRYGFAAESWDRTQALTIDPGMTWSTYLGGSGQEDALEVRCLNDGTFITVGGAPSSGFPTTTGAYSRTAAGSEGFIAVMDPRQLGAAQLIYGTYIGGGAAESANSVSVDDRGIITVVGDSSSSNFPTTPGAYDSSGSGGKDIFVAQLDPSLVGTAQLLYGTLVGGSEADVALAVGTQPNGAITVAGETKSDDFPLTSNAFDRTFEADDGLVIRLDPSQSGAAQLVYSSYLGGNSYDTVNGVHVDPAGRITVVGLTESPDYPTSAGAIDRFYGGGADDGFLSQLDITLQGAAQLAYSTYLGGVSSDTANAVDVHADTGLIAVGGWTWSDDFPTTSGSYDTVMDGFSDAYVALIVPAPIGPAQLVYSSYVGGTGHDSGWAIALHNDLVITLAGKTRSLDFPTTSGAASSILAGSGTTPPNDAWIVRIDGSLPRASQLLYGSYLGGDSTDTAEGVCVHRTGEAILMGQARSANFPVTNGAYQTAKKGGRDVFLTLLDMLPIGTSRFGNPTPGCDGPHAISVVADPVVGSNDFAVTSSFVPSQVPGLLAISGQRLTTALPLGGVELWVDLVQAPVVLVPVTSGPFGGARVAMPIPKDPLLAGAEVYCQFLWFGPTGPSCPPFGMSATHGLAIEIQP